VPTLLKIPEKSGRPKITCLAPSMSNKRNCPDPYKIIENSCKIGQTCCQIGKSLQIPKQSRRFMRIKLSFQMYDGGCWGV